MPASLQAGKPDPIGAQWDGLGVIFAIFSAHAERVELCLFDPGGHRQLRAGPRLGCRADGAVAARMSRLPNPRNQPGPAWSQA